MKLKANHNATLMKTGKIVLIIVTPVAITGIALLIWYFMKKKNDAILASETEKTPKI